MNFEMAQVDQEIDALADVFKRENVRSYLEIGSKFGGSLWRIGSSLPKGSTIVSVDMPNGTRAWKQSKDSLNRCAAKLAQLGHHVVVLWGDSTDDRIVREVKGLGPFDAILIDANHTLPYVRRDWINYGPMGRLIAFHDISWKRAPAWEGVRIDVPEFWEEAKQAYRHEEFRFCPTGKNNGIGVLWRE